MLPGRGRWRPTPRDGNGRSPHEVHLRVWTLPAQERLQLHDPTLPVERFQVVGHHHQGGLRRRCRVSLAGSVIDERPRPAGLDGPGEPVPGVAEVGDVRSRPGAERAGQCRGHGRIGGQRRHRIDPVEGLLLVEMDDVVQDELGAHEQVPDQPGVARDRHPEGVLDGPDRCHRVDARAGAADALGE